MELSRLSLEDHPLSEENVVAEPFRFSFEIAWEVAHKGQKMERLDDLTPYLSLSLPVPSSLSWWHTYSY